MTDYDVIIVGAGSMGLSAAYQLAKAKRKVLLLDGADAPHDYGSHGGHTRLIRHALGEGLHYVPLALRSQAIWNDIEKYGPDDTFMETGVLTFGLSDSEEVKTAMKAALEFNLNCQIFTSGKGMNEQWPGLNLPDDFIGIYEPHAGILDANTAIDFFRDKALDLDAQLETDSAVESIEWLDDKHVRVHTETNSYEGEKVILTAGAYTNQLLESLDLKLAIQPSRRTVTWFETDEDLYSADVFPGYIGKVDQGYDCYGFPSVKGSGMKIGSYNYGHDADIEDIDFDYGNDAADEGIVRFFLDKYLPQAAAKELEGEVALFQMTPDEDFIIDFHPDYSNIIIAAGFAGHGFKFVPAIGEILSQLAQDGETDYDISAFDIERPAIILD